MKNPQDGFWHHPPDSSSMSIGIAFSTLCDHREVSMVFPDLRFTQETLATPPRILDSGEQERLQSLAEKTKKEIAYALFGNLEPADVNDQGRSEQSEQVDSRASHNPFATFTQADLDRSIIQQLIPQNDRPAILRNLLNSFGSQYGMHRLNGLNGEIGIYFSLPHIFLVKNCGQVLKKYDVSFFRQVLEAPLK